ncbi:MAG: 4-phosphopantetheinyl transferase [Methylocystaceae bacterium]|nr:MAG: 4-phosphopantetheinyl transferase [Methylocystaceae bacterium]
MSEPAPRYHFNVAEIPTPGRVALHRLRLPRYVPEDVEVFRLDFDLVNPAPSADWAVLGDDERERAAKFHRHDDRVRAIATRAALRRLLGERLHREPGALRFDAGPHGKPLLREGAALEFNVSHSGGFALIALSRTGAVGVDIERRDRAIDVTSLASLVLSPDEQAAGEGGVDAFFERWVVKEAILKALGLGVAEQLQALSVWRPGAAEEYELRHAEEDWSGVGAWALDAPPGYAAALAFAKRG